MVKSKSCHRRWCSMRAWWRENNAFNCQRQSNSTSQTVVRKSDHGDRRKHLTYTASHSIRNPLRTQQLSRHLIIYPCILGGEHLHQGQSQRIEMMESIISGDGDCISVLIGETRDMVAVHVAFGTSLPSFPLLNVEELSHTLLKAWCF